MKLLQKSRLRLRETEVHPQPVFHVIQKILFPSIQ